LDDEPALSRSVKVQEGSGIFAFDFRENSEKEPLQLPQRAAHGHVRLCRVHVRDAGGTSWSPRRFASAVPRGTRGEQHNYESFVFYLGFFGYSAQRLKKAPEKKLKSELLERKF
jgi:hypothetical protein